jgi:hypothetical protein
MYVDPDVPLDAEVEPLPPDEPDAVEPLALPPEPDELVDPDPLDPLPVVDPDPPADDRDPEPVIAFVRMKLLVLELLAELPLPLPVVPTEPLESPRCRQPVTVIVWADCELRDVAPPVCGVVEPLDEPPDCAAAAPPHAMAIAAPNQMLRMFMCMFSFFNRVRAGFCKR